MTDPTSSSSPRSTSTRRGLARSRCAHWRPGLCHSDLHYLDGVLTRPRPVLLGHEAVGVVEAVGPGVESVAVGDHVVTCLVVGCGTCARCEQGEPFVCSNPNATRRPRGERARLLTTDGRSIGTMANIGSFSDRMLVDERALVRVPASMPPTLAAIVGCAVVTGLGSVFNVARRAPHRHALPSSDAAESA